MVNKNSMFNKLDKTEQDLFISKLLQVVRNNDRVYVECNRLINEQDRKGAFKDTKFFNQHIFEQ